MGITIAFTVFVYAMAIVVDFIPIVKKKEPRIRLFYAAFMLVSFITLVLYIFGAPVSGILGFFG